MGIQVLANLVLLKCSINVLIILYINFWQIHSQLLDSLSFPNANHLTIHYYSYKYFLTTDLRSYYKYTKPVKQSQNIKPNYWMQKTPRSVMLHTSNNL